MRRLGYDEFSFWIDTGMSFARKKASLNRLIRDVMPAFCLKGPPWTASSSISTAAFEDGAEGFDSLDPATGRLGRGCRWPGRRMWIGRFRRRTGPLFRVHGLR
jgi:hypothetical protein